MDDLTVRDRLKIRDAIEELDRTWDCDVARLLRAPRGSDEYFRRSPAPVLRRVLGIASEEEEARLVKIEGEKVVSAFGARSK